MKLSMTLKVIKGHKSSSSNFKIIFFWNIYFFKNENLFKTFQEYQHYEEYFFLWNEV